MTISEHETCCAGMVTCEGLCGCAGQRRPHKRVHSTYGDLPPHQDQATEKAQATSCPQGGKASFRAQNRVGQRTVSRVGEGGR